jgi:cytochrome c
MDSLDVNKAVAAVLVAGIAFFVTGLIGDNLIYETQPIKPPISIQGVKPAGETGGAPKPEELPPIAPLLAKANIGQGKQFVDTVCAACHSFNKGGKPIVGPNLYGIVGDPHDHEAGFDYSQALEKFKGQPWTYEALNHWLFDPAKYAPGTKMTFAGIPQAQLRADVIDYLHTLSDHPEPLPNPQAASKPAAPAAPNKPATASPTVGGAGPVNAGRVATKPGTPPAASNTSPPMSQPAAPAKATPAAPAKSNP